MAIFNIKPDIAKANTLHKNFYTSPRLFDSCKEKIFAHFWQFLGNTDLIKEPGDVYPFILLEGFLNEPLVLTKDKEGIIHLLSNVCTHRGNLIATSPCKLSNLRCKYHGRLFQLDGRFLSMPEFKEVKNFPSPQDDLKELPIFQWGKWLFCSFGIKISPELILKDMMDRVGWMPIENFVFRPELSKEFTVNAHWALYCENYLEGFHIPFVHAGLNDIIDFGNYHTELYTYSCLQSGIGKDLEDCFELPPASPDYGKKVAAYYFFVFPNLMFNFYPWGLSVNVVNPVDLSKTKVSFYTYVWDPKKYNSGAGSDLQGVEMEDEEIVESVQKGIRSRFYTHGRYSVNREQGTHHFHRILSNFL